MSLYITNFSSLWKENRCAPALIDDSTIDDLFVDESIEDLTGDEKETLLVVVEEHANGINQLYVYQTPNELVELTGEWVKVDNRWLEGDTCEIEDIERYYDGDLLYTSFYDRPNYWPPVSVPSVDEGSLVPLKFHRARPFEDS